MSLWTFTMNPCWKQSHVSICYLFVCVWVTVWPCVCVWLCLNANMLCLIWLKCFDEVIYAESTLRHFAFIMRRHGRRFNETRRKVMKSTNAHTPTRNLSNWRNENVYWLEQLHKHHEKFNPKTIKCANLCEILAALISDSPVLNSIRRPENDFENIIFTARNEQYSRFSSHRIRRLI